MRSPLPVAIKVEASSSSSLVSGKISILDGSASSQGSGSSSSNSTSDDTNSSGSDSSENEITLGDADAGKNDVSVEEGKIITSGNVASGDDPGENLDDVDVNPTDLVVVKPSNCFMGQSLMTQAELDSLVSEGCFIVDACRPAPKLGESVVCRIFFTAGLRLPVSKRFVEILATYKVQIHQLTPNSIPQILNFLWSRRTFGGTNDVDTFV
jgi:hypothetical protein